MTAPVCYFDKLTAAGVKAETTMSKAINDGGYAFPGDRTHDRDGMSLRDYLAAKALIAFPHICCGADLTLPELAHEAYALADAMLVAREKKP